MCARSTRVLVSRLLLLLLFVLSLNKPMTLLDNNSHIDHQSDSVL